uniref:Uncharacterized protein n=1 Tax=Salix viminalis TaxID=40686 RepID=A0A6N2MUY8_SALVM
MTEFRLRCPDWWSPISGLPHHRLINIVGHVYVWRGKEIHWQQLKTPASIKNSSNIWNMQGVIRLLLLNFTASQLMGFPYGSMPHRVPSIETTEPCESNLGTKFEVVTNIEPL